MSFNGDLYPTAGANVVMTTTGDLVRYNAGARQRLGIGSVNEVLTVVGGLPAWASAGHVTQSRAMEVACSDETTALTATTNLVTFRMPYAMTLGSGINGIRASLTGAGSTSGVTTIDVNQGGASILSTKLTIDYGELTSYTGATPVVILTSALTDNNYLTVDVDGLSGGADETGLKIQLIGTLA
jgi:hypothetical protein